MYRQYTHSYHYFEDGFEVGRVGKEDGFEVSRVGLDDGLAVGDDDGLFVGTVGNMVDGL